jgi:hypothetical protein
VDGVDEGEGVGLLEGVASCVGLVAAGSVVEVLLMVS